MSDISNENKIHHTGERKRISDIGGKGITILRMSLGVEFQSALACLYAEGQVLKDA